MRTDAATPYHGRMSEAATAPISTRLLHVAADIKLAHSVFALPFALLATFLAAGGYPGHLKLALIIWCMVAARTFAMLANRYHDRDLDARNPRTAKRAIPAGRVSAGDVRGIMSVTAVAFILGAAMFGVIFDNWWPTYLSPLVLAWLVGYAFMKRFTLLCHFYLGAALAISPVAAVIAIRPAYLAEPTAWWLAAFVLLWVAGFDIIYACQDIDADRREGLHSIPAKLGETGALVVAKIAHLLALIALVLTEATERDPQHLGTLFKAGFIIVGVALMIEHYAARRGKFSMAFFTLNGVIALGLGALGIADVVT